jgi:pilus assembly protein CpaC
VPIVQGGGDRSTVSVVFKEYGVRLNFKPTIIDEDHIRLELEPEVSTIDFANGVKFDGFLIPALRTRRAKTGVELRDGQSFALAGLLDNNETRSLSKIPVLGDIPVLGALFKSKSFQKSETELMFIVTAQMVKPVNRDELPQMRGIDGLKNGSPLGLEPKGEGIEGESGYKISGQKSEATPAAAPQTQPTTNGSEPKSINKTTEQSGQNTKGARLVNQPLPPPTVTAASLTGMGTNPQYKPE